MLNTDLFENIIDQLHQHITYLTFYFQGEPFLHKDFLKMVKYASSKNIYTATSTNAHYLDDERAKEIVLSGLDRLIISVDGTTQDTYGHYRIGGSLEKVLDGARNIVKWKKELKSTTPYLIFQFVVFSHNEHQVKDLNAIAGSIGIDEVVVKTAQVYDYKYGNSFIPQSEQFSRYKKNRDGTFEIKNKLLNHCWKLWHSCVITWDGEVVPCCFDKDAAYKMGNLKEHSFMDTWNNDQYIHFRTSLLKSRSKIDICQNCTEGTKVRV
jgi:radical SAM protein with 4Fe4S-binding SPASM domain